MVSVAVRFHSAKNLGESTDYLPIRITPPDCYDLLTPKCPFCNLPPTKIGIKCAKVVKIGGEECVDWSGYAVGALSIFVPSRVIGVRFFSLEWSD
jgi:hypothetical protein